MNGLAEQVPLSGPVGSPSPETGLTLRHALLFALGYAPLLVAFFLNLWARPHYQFFPLALAPPPPPPPFPPPPAPRPRSPAACPPGRLLPGARYRHAVLVPLARQSGGHHRPDRGPLAGRRQTAIASPGACPRFGPGHHPATPRARRALCRFLARLGRQLEQSLARSVERNPFSERQHYRAAHPEVAGRGSLQRYQFGPHHPRRLLVLYAVAARLDHLHGHQPGRHRLVRLARQRRPHHPRRLA